MKKIILGMLGLLVLVPAPALPSADHSMAPQRGSLARLERTIERGDLSLRQMVRLQNEILTAPRDRGGSGLIARVPRSAPAAASTDHDASPLAVADLDGDSLDEVIVSEYPYSYPCLCLPFLLLDQEPGHISVWDGDGAHRWSIETDQFAYLQLADLTGDELPEVIVVERRSVRVALSAEAVRSITTISVVRPQGGTVVWSKPFESTYYVAGVSALVAGAHVEGVRGLIVGIQAIPDASGDGLADLFVEQRDYDWALTAAGVRPMRATGLTLRGTDGREIAAIEALAAPAVIGLRLGASADVAPMGDLNGDGLSDAVTVESVAALATLSARSIDGSSRYWRREYAPSLEGPTRSGDLEIRPMELDGTAGLDTLVFSNNEVVEAVAGATGSTLWVAADPKLFHAIVVGDADGDGGDDLAPDLSGEDEATDAAVVSGRTGEVVWHRHFEQEPSPPNGYSAVSVGPYPDDLSGDGVSEFAVSYARYTDGELVSLNRVVVSGVNGQELWRIGPFDEYWDAPSSIPADLDGDLGSDLISWTHGLVEVTAGATGESLWSAQASVPIDEDSSITDFAWFSLRRAEGRALVLGVWEEVEGTVTTRTRVIDPTGEIWAL